MTGNGREKQRVEDGQEGEVMAKPTGAKTRDHMARITVSDEVWGEFREAARVRAISVTAYLAQLVSKEVLKLRADGARAETLTARHAAAALADARSLGKDLAAIANRLEVLTKHPYLVDLATEPRPDRRADVPPTDAELEAMTDDELQAMIPTKPDPLPDDWMVRQTEKKPDDWVPPWEP